MPDYQALKRAAEAFDINHSHGGHRVFVGKGDRGYYLFPDGARREYQEAFMCPGEEPPTDERERKILILKYHEIRAATATAAFNKLAAELKQKAELAIRYADRRQAPDPPSPCENQKVADLKVEMLVRQELYTRLRDEFGDLRSDFEKYKEQRAIGNRDYALRQGEELSRALHG